jgi:tRNA(Ile2) C34 agmatinyltransferase TiaS
MMTAHGARGNGRSLNGTDHDPVEDMREPTCPDCGTVLWPAGHGYQCRGCRLAFRATVDPPT